MNENPMEQVEQTPETPAAEPVPAPEQKKGLSENAKEWIKDILIAIVVAFLVLQFIKPTIVQEHSMENTLVANDYLFISKQSYRLFGDPQRGDIIVFHSSLTTSDGSEKLLVKRIIKPQIGDLGEFSKAYQRYCRRQQYAVDKKSGTLI